MNQWCVCAYHLCIDLSMLIGNFLLLPWSHSRNLLSIKIQTIKPEKKGSDVIHVTRKRSVEINLRFPIYWLKSNIPDRSGYFRPSARLIPSLFIFIQNGKDFFHLLTKLYLRYLCTGCVNGMRIAHIYEIPNRATNIKWTRKYS